MTRWLGLSMVLTVAALAASLYVSLVDVNLLPEKVPTHWNIEGRPDAWVPREQAWKYLVLMPAVMAGMTLLTVVLPWVSPKRFEPARFRPTWDYVMALVVLLFAYLNAVILLASAEVNFDLGRLMVAGFFLFFALIGNVIGKVRRNFWMGVRTPWTLASEVVWNRTHRVTAWVWVTTGLLGFVAVLVGLPLILAFVLMLVAVVLVPILYSLVLYKVLQKQGKLNEPDTEVSDPAAGLG